LEDILIIKTLAVGPFMANCYILGCESSKEAAVIDPGGDTDKILLALAESKLKTTAIINTHAHVDHAAGNGNMKNATGADLLLHELEIPLLRHISESAASWGLSVDDSPPPDRTVREGDTIDFGAVSLNVIHTPGHSPGGISLHTNGYVFVGDTLFAGSIGRTDLPGGNYDTLISSIQTKLFSLGDDVRVFTGHGPETTIEREKNFNPFVNML
jgi:glyoxylase-like metal-dependent hydrolase (beta-lactamase superfamily II)